MNNISINEIKFISKPLSFLTILVILFVMVILIGVNKVSAFITKTKDSQITEEQLTRKISILSEVSKLISEDTTFLDIVIPSKTPVLYSIGQIKNESLKNNLLVSNIKTSSPNLTEVGIYESSINFDLDGEKSSIYNFINSFSKILPLIKIDKVRISNTVSLSHAAISLKVFSSELPKAIPAVSNITKDLTDEEINLLKELATYTMPVFIEPKLEMGQIRDDIFN